MLNILIMICLYFCYLDRQMEQIRDCKRSYDFEHSFDVLFIVKKQKVFFFRVVAEHIFMINVNQLAAGILILTNSGGDKCLNRLLFAIRKLQERFVGGKPPVDINSFQIIKIKVDMILFKFTVEIRNIKLIAVEVDQVPIGFGKCYKCLENIHFVLVICCHPLNCTPCSRLNGCIIVCAADHVQIGAAYIKSCSFYVNKQCLTWNTEIFDWVFGP